MLFSKSYRSQLYATVFANLTSFAYGISLGWPSPILPLLQSTKSPFRTPLTTDEISWIASVYLIGGMLSTPLFGWSANKFGRKKTLLVSVFPQMLSWAIVEFSSSAFHLYVARFMVGFGGTGFYLVVPMYVAEISSNNVRGALGSIMMVATNLGIVVGYTINSYLDYYTCPFIVLSIFIIFLIGFPFAADSPKHLMAQNQTEGAIAALKYFRGYTKSDQHFSKEFADEIEVLKNSGQLDSTDKGGKLSIKDFCSKSALLSILIGVVLMFLEVVNGFTAISNYSETIFTDAGSTFSPALSTVFLGIILLVGSYSSTLLVEKAGRKILMIISAMGCGVTLSLVGAYSYLKDNGYDVTPYNWLPLICLSLFMLLGSIGVFSLHLIIISEVLAQKIRGVVLTFLVFENWFVSFLTVKYFPILLAIIGMHGCMLIFALTCFSGALFVLLVLPETKGKSIEDIVKELQGKK